eukprot:jgi/Botrbrau1/13670/Bobra.0378s0004.1
MYLHRTCGIWKRSSPPGRRTDFLEETCLQSLNVLCRECNQKLLEMPHLPSPEGSLGSLPSAGSIEGAEVAHEIPRQHEATSRPPPAEVPPQSPQPIHQTEPYTNLPPPPPLPLGMVPPGLGLQTPDSKRNKRKSRWGAPLQESVLLPDAPTQLAVPSDGGRVLSPPEGDINPSFPSRRRKTGFSSGPSEKEELGNGSAAPPDSKPAGSKPAGPSTDGQSDMQSRIAQVLAIASAAAAEQQQEVAEPPLPMEPEPPAPTVPPAPPAPPPPAVAPEAPPYPYYPTVQNPWHGYGAMYQPEPPPPPTWIAPPPDYSRAHLPGYHWYAPSWGYNGVPVPPAAPPPVPPPPVPLPRPISLPPPAHLAPPLATIVPPPPPPSPPGPRSITSPTSTKAVQLASPVSDKPPGSVPPASPVSDKPPALLAPHSPVSDKLPSSPGAAALQSDEGGPTRAWLAL